MKRLKTFAACSAALALVCFLLSSFATRQTPEPPDALRLHILANSDSEEDQRVKLLVRDAVLGLFRERFSADTKTEAVDCLLSLGPELQQTAERVLEENGMEPRVTLEAGEFDFPDRSYGDEFYPAGRYAALRVILGEGAGHNWWCVMFPPLCVIDTGTGTQYNDNGTLEFRSFFAELLRGLFG